MKPLIKKIIFNNTIKGIFKTPPITYRVCSSVTVVSMVSEDTLAMYLVAIKSFMKFFGYGTIEAINDGTLKEPHINILKQHIPHIVITLARDIETHGCPCYISWKRLFRIQELAKSSYVIQLDTDTISLGPLCEVNERVKKNKGFLIGSKRWGIPVDVQYLNDIVSQWNSHHVQARAEKQFKKMIFFEDGTKYLRACAGFAGYPKNFASIETIKDLSQEIESYIGEDWKKWGSEQTATLCLISKTKTASILPWPYYQNFKFPICNEHLESMNFIHFIGTNRYDGNTYNNLIKKFINSYK